MLNAISKPLKNAALWQSSQLMCLYMFGLTTNTGLEHSGLKVIFSQGHNENLGGSQENWVLSLFKRAVQPLLSMFPSFRGFHSGNPRSTKLVQT